MTSNREPWPAVSAGFALPIATALLLGTGAVAAGSHAQDSIGVVVTCAVVVGAIACLSKPAAAAPMALVGWMTASAFASPPYGQLRPTAPIAALAAMVVAAAAALGVMLGVAARSQSRWDRRTLRSVSRFAGYAAAIGRRRRVWAVALAAGLLPALTVGLTADRHSLSLADDVLAYLIAVIAVAVVGGFGPAIAAAIVASLLLNWFFTKPFHTLTIAAPDNLLSVLLFIVVATMVSSVVHVAARRAQQAARSQSESETLLSLARMVLAGDDTPAAVLEHLHQTLGVGAELVERAGDRWVTIASSGPTDIPATSRVEIRAGLALLVRGGSPGFAGLQLADAVAGQAAAALDRDRLRTQAAQAEMLAAGNRMRTALLAAVSHDLRTPLASLKAAISSLRQTDVSWSPDDERILLETIEQSTDRLGSLIANLLDMSRIQTGALQPYLKPAAVDEVAPVALRGLPDGSTVRLEVPDDLPLVLTDAGLLERALANLLANALRHSPADRPPTLSASTTGDRIEIQVVDHGPGVAVADRERIFEPFQRLGDQRSTTGIGLGLAVARGFVEAVGGTIAAGETPGGGLTMTVSLPAATRVVTAAVDQRLS